MRYINLLTYLLTSTATTSTVYSTQSHSSPTDPAAGTQFSHRPKVGVGPYSCRVKAATAHSTCG